MTKPKAAATPPLYYTGADGHPFLLDVPARDLTPHDVERVAFIRSAPVDAVVADLVATGLYSLTPPPTD